MKEIGSEIILASEEFITVKYLPERGIIYHTIHKPMTGKPLHNILDKAAEFLKEQGVRKWLSDDRKNGPIPPEDALWGRDWNQRMIKAGWKYWAIVVPAEIHAAGALSPVIDELYELGLRMMVFSDIEKAFEWLDSME